MVEKKKLKKISLILGIIFLIIILFFLYFKVEIISELVNLIIISAIIAYVLKPLRDILKNKFGLSKRISTLIILVGLILLITVFIVVTIPKLINEAGNIGEIFEKLNLYFIEFEKNLRLNNNTVINTLYNQGQEKMWRFLANLSYESLDFIINLSKNILSYIIIPILSYYFLSDGDKIANSLYMLIPIRKRNLIRKIFKDINILLERYILSQIVLCGITTILSFFLFWALGLKFTFLLAVINGVFNIVPYFGAIFGGIPAVFIALIQSPSLAIWTIIGILIVQQIEGNLIAPKVTADSTDIHPMIIIVLLILGEKLGGIGGMIFIIPLAVIVKVIYDDINYYIF
ncbi:AI-2E family transporter [Clostridium thermobutyricum]|uniref:AI-2E family transporter n=1 Tax=Clostridium thermobutyricum TaxID=29372 RepID=UPI0018AADD55|nr:AI-2E family transporter [Clostridium thermobutyricum]